MPSTGGIPMSPPRKRREDIGNGGWGLKKRRWRRYIEYLLNTYWIDIEYICERSRRRIVLWPWEFHPNVTKAKSTNARLPFRSNMFYTSTYHGDNKLLTWLANFEICNQFADWRNAEEVSEINFSMWRIEVDLTVLLLVLFQISSFRLLKYYIRRTQTKRTFNCVEKI